MFTPDTKVTATKYHRKDKSAEGTKRTLDLTGHRSIVFRGDLIGGAKLKGVCAWMNPNGTGGFRLKMSAGPQINVESFSLEALTALRDQLSHVIDNHENFPYGSGLFNSIGTGDI